MDTPRHALITMVVSSFSLPLMLSAVNVALPSVARELRLDAVSLTWVQLIFLTSSAATVLSFGRLSDIIGRKRVFTWGIRTLLVSSVLAACAADGTSLLVARALQGMAAAMVYSTHIGILTSIYPPEKRGEAIGTLVAAVYFGLTCGPLLGGWLIEIWGWRAAFLGHLPLTVGVLLAGIPRLKGEWKAEDPGRFDSVGAILYAGGIALLMWGGTRLPGLEGAGALALGAVGIIAFVRQQYRRPDPIFDVRLFHTNRVFALSSLASLLMYATTYSILVQVSLYLQFLQGMEALQAGLIMLAQPAVSAVFSPFAGRLSDRVEPRIIASTGVLLVGLGLWMLSLLDRGSSPHEVVVCLVATGLGFSLFSSPNANAIMSGVERRLYGVAGGVVATMRILGQLASMGLVAATFALTLGRVEIMPETHEALAQALSFSFRVSALVCVPALVCSLARGRLHALT